MTTLVDRIRQCTQELEEVQADFDFKYGPWDTSAKLVPPFTSAMVAARATLAQVETEFLPPYRLAGYSSLGAKIENLAPQWQHFHADTQLHATLLDCFQEFRRRVPSGRFQVIILSLLNGITGDVTPTFVDSSLFEDVLAAQSLYQDWQGLLFRMATLQACIADYQDFIQQGLTVHPFDAEPPTAPAPVAPEVAALAAFIKGAHLIDVEEDPLPILPDHQGQGEDEDEDVQF